MIVRVFHILLLCICRDLPMGRLPKQRLQQTLKNFATFKTLLKLIGPDELISKS